jgi:glycolate oxidase FAD binding subunit
LNGAPDAGQSTETLITTSLSRIVDYPARDMTITVEAGLKVEELQRTLQAQGQTLPLDIPEARRATIGGAMAANAAGPGRFGYGTFRDYVIGLRAVDGRGRLFAAGGRVVKNVAGYDLCKMLTGSRGQLAAIAEVTLKLRPLPETRRLVWTRMGDFPAVEAALAALVRTATRPVAVEVFNRQAARHITREAQLALPDDGPVLCVAFDGSDRETAWQVERFCTEVAASAPAAREIVDPDDALELWSVLTEYRTASDEPLTLQAATPPSRVVEFLKLMTDGEIAAQAHAANGVVIGHLSDRCTDPSAGLRMLAPLREFVQACQGSISVTRCDPEWLTTFHGLCRPQTSPLERELVRALDPQGLFVW